MTLAKNNSKRLVHPQLALRSGLATLLFCCELLLGKESELPALLEEHLEFYCYDCHGGGVKKGGLDLEATPFNFSNPQNFEKWVHVFDRIQSGEMPPKDEEQLTQEEQGEVLQALYPKLLQADRSDTKAKGRVRGRRLTRTEYENTVHDLLGIRIPLANLLPNDESDEEFQTVADSQQLSHFHLNQYLQAADLALHTALGRSEREEKGFIRNYNADHLTAHINSGGQNYRGPQKKNGRVYSWNRGIAFNGSMRATRVPDKGWYRIAITNLQAINPGEDEVVWGTLKTGAGLASQAQLYLAGIIEGSKTPKDLSFDTWMEEGDLLVLKPDEGDTRFMKGNQKRNLPYYHGRDLEKEGVTALAFDKISLTRIYPGGNRFHIRKLLLPGIEFQNGQAIFNNPEAQIKRLILDFGTKAFRHPVEASQILPYQMLAWQRFQETDDFLEALHEGYRAILCSPRFLTFVEPPGPLDDHAIASRLSFLFWSSLPDDELLSLAHRGQLNQPEALKGQVRRMLAHPKSERFITNFTDQWLQLAEIDFTAPDPRRFKNFDPVLQESMLQETRSFFRELLNQNLSVTNFIDSEFAMLNTRLQRHYHLNHLKVTPGEGLQRVQVKPKDRSGLVTQASILKVTADGSVTSPVIRGVWIGERILGLHIPPPPANVPAIEPDIRGAISIRDQLEKHRADPSCAACHTKIDPQGFALESFDPIGSIRSYYGATKKSAKVDPSGVTPEGETFSNIEGWKKLYQNRPRMLAKAFVNQFLTFATGAEIRFGDRPAVEAILEQAKDQNYGLRSLLEASLTSEIFLNK